MILCVGGQGRKAGKSSVVAGLIRALPEARWTAVKISRHAHSSRAARGLVIREQLHADATDTGRFLAAGATRAYLVEAEGEEIGELMPELRALLGSAENVIAESTGLAAWIRPDLFLMVVDPAAGEWKPAAQAQAEIADAFVVVDRGPAARHESLPASKPCFFVRPPAYVSPELVALVSGRLALHSGAGNPPLKAPQESVSRRARRRDLPPLPGA